MNMEAETMKLTLTKELIYAAGKDAADRQMRAAGRTTWNEQDYRLACTTLNLLALRVAPETLREWGWA